jgi:small subunit ribosomal protein S9
VNDQEPTDQPEEGAEEPVADEPAAEEEARETRPDADPSAPGREAEEADGSDSASGDDSREAAPAAAAGSGSEPEAKKAADIAPGADLEPIDLEGDRELTAEERARIEAEAEERAAREAEATAESDEELPVRKPAEIPADTRVQATGKRKSSVARVIVKAGSGGFQINRRELAEYFPRPHHQALARQPLVATGFEESVDVTVRVHGGGISGQAGAVRHGVARALTEIESELRHDLKRRGMLTRDARRKERRKAGLKKARKRPQFSKR